jgi:hypothetical protein
MMLVASLLLLPTSAPVVARMLAEVPGVLRSQLLLKFMLSILVASLLLLVSLLLLAFMLLLALLLLQVHRLLLAFFLSFLLLLEFLQLLTFIVLMASQQHLRSCCCTVVSGLCCREILQVLFPFIFHTNICEAN